MSKQRDILTEVLSFVRQHAPDCPVYLSGSVALCHERPDSDIDLVVIVPNVAAVRFPDGEVEVEDNDFRLISVIHDEVRLHLHVASTSLLRMFEAHPWRSYKFLQMEFLCDPDGAVQNTMDTIRPWFDEHPDAVLLWKQWLSEHEDRQLSGGKRIGPLLQQYPNQMPDFWGHLDGVYGGGVTT